MIQSGPPSVISILINSKSTEPNHGSDVPHQREGDHRRLWVIGDNLIILPITQQRELFGFFLFAIRGYLKDPNHGIGDLIYMLNKTNAYRESVKNEANWVLCGSEIRI